MNVFDLRQKLITDYGRYTSSFIKISDADIKAFVDGALAGGLLWPEPLLQLNPTFRPGGKVSDLVAEGVLHPECAKIFRIKTEEDSVGIDLLLHTHQSEAIRLARKEKSYVLTSGTGSGKSLAYIVPIVDHVLRRGSGRGIQAIVVYPMNALANSQEQELRKFLEFGYGKGQEPVRFARFTGQEKGPEREAIRANPPDILLTNYMMLELLLTRIEDRELVRSAQGLRFLVFDELHTYRGRQGADIAMLIRRCRNAFAGENMVCVGTSATMSSEGTVIEQRRDVSNVASSLFGADIGPAQVIGETLERSTTEPDVSLPSVRAGIAAAILGDSEPPESYADFCAHPLPGWIESTFGVRAEPETGDLIRQRPRRLTGEESAARDLKELTGAPIDRCEKVLRDYLLHGSQLWPSISSRFPVFAFRLHQFLTRGDTVWATLEAAGARYLSLSKLGSKPGEDNKPLFPLVFCRHCGATYYRVSDKGELLLPREDRVEVNGDDELPRAYLYVSADRPWPQAAGPALLDRLPADFKEATVDGDERLIPDRRGDLPRTVFVDATGQLTSEGQGVPAALIKNDFHFCLNCQVTHAKNQKSERAKLLTLGVDSRSTATTILAVRALLELQGDRDLKPEARKLLSFTDNRQDASLQAGHFNDFAQVALLRSALHRALAGAGATGLGHADLSREVFKAMSLDFDDYAADPDVRGVARNETDDALRRVAEYYLYRDLQRGWRVTAPNLEDCGLLVFDYSGLSGADGLLGEEELWNRGFKIRVDGREERTVQPPAALSTAPSEIREEMLRTLLDVLRRAVVVKADCLDPVKQRDLVDQTRPRLQEGTVWYLDEPADLVRAKIAYPCQRPQRADQQGLYVSSFGGFGRYVRRVLRQQGVQQLRREDIDEIIRFLLLALKRYGIVEQVRSGDVPGFQINHSAMRWMVGDAKIRPVDRTRIVETGEVPPEANEYFVEYYRHFVDLQCVLEGREHTAQVAPELREQREDDFRVAKLPLLFCSPTMELGVDISQLNVVNLRNVPPTPANYAQRSGRAGRGGQPALVYTYCAGRSPHDQYYFRQPERMVAGSVTPPRIDLRNQGLVQSHVHAVWMEVAKPDLGKTLTSVLDILVEGGRINLPVKEELMKRLKDPALRAEARSRAQKLLDSISEELKSATWYFEGWLDNALAQIPQSFDKACDRWRSQYRAATTQREMHHKIIGDHSRPEQERTHSRRLRDQAEAQIRLLTEAGGVMEGDFYSYRYFATEGFLPGYNFPRLPISAFVPGRRGRRGRDEFVSRARFLAISEFGPRALVYHEGSRYRVYKVNLDFGADDGGLVTARMKRCTSCGYGHLEEGVSLSEVCERCGTALGTDSLLSELVQLQNVSLRVAQRITCDEEERQRYGYRINTAYRFSELGGKLDRKDAEVVNGETVVLRLSYGDATRLYRINQGWTKTKRGEPPGFFLDLEKGYWANNPVDKDDASEGPAANTRRVVPFVEDTKNALIIRPEPALPTAELAGLQSALKEAIQKFFQIEPRELAAEPMPDRNNRREILLYEASEGGAGVLRQIVENPDVLPALARTALTLCHFDPDTLTDQAADRCGKACYECLLDYGNQFDHQNLDRHKIKNVLKTLAASHVRPAGGIGTRGERLAELQRRCETQLERRWLDLIEEHNLRLPTDAQHLIEVCTTRPDFYYRDHGAAIYVDGPVHDEPAQVRKDEAITRSLIQESYIVIRFHHKADWPAILRQHPDIFGALPV